MALFSQLGKYNGTGLFIMRVGLGAMMMIVHGFPKLTGGAATWEKLGYAMGNLNIHFLPVFWGFMSAITETIGGMFAILGLWFRLVCILMVINLGVAALSQYSGAGGAWKEAAHAMELGFAFAGLVFLGPGRYSVDKG